MKREDLRMLLNRVISRKKLNKIYSKFDIRIHPLEPVVNFTIKYYQLKNEIYGISKIFDKVEIQIAC